MKMIIGGKKTDSSNGRTIDVINPATGEFIDTVPAATTEDVDRALELSKIGFKKWSATPVSKRKEIFQRFVKLMYRDDNLRWIIQSTAREMGSNAFFAGYGVTSIEDLLMGYIETVRRYDGDVLMPNAEPGDAGNPSGDMMLVVHEPVGTVVSILPFNGPMLMFGFKVAPALAAGNAVIVKPASDDPLVIIRLVELMIEAGVPGEALQVITGRGSDLGNSLFDDPRVNLVTMTGSTEVGVEIAKFGAKYLYPCELELGGNDPLIVMNDVDVAKVAAEAAAIRISNGGQICVSPKRMIIHRDIADRFTLELLEHFKKVELGFFSDIDRAFDELTAKYGRFPTLGELAMESDNYLRGHNYIQPVINEKAAANIISQIEHTVAQGATLLYGGHRRGCFVEPTILTNVTRAMDIAKDMEVFGPVAPIIPFDTVEEAIDIANQSSFGLSGGVFTNDWKLGMRIAREIQSGGIVVNGTGMFRADMQPFGGYKRSGLGREGLITLGELMQEKTIVMKGFLK